MNQRAIAISLVAVCGVFGIGVCGLAMITAEFSKHKSISAATNNVAEVVDEPQPKLLETLPAESSYHFQEWPVKFTGVGPDVVAFFLSMNTNENRKLHHTFRFTNAVNSELFTYKDTKLPIWAVCVGDSDDLMTITLRTPAADYAAGSQPFWRCAHRMFRAVDPSWSSISQYIKGELAGGYVTRTGVWMKRRDLIAHFRRRADSDGVDWIEFVIGVDESTIR